MTSVANASSPIVLEMHDCGRFLCPAKGRLPFGLLISAYSTNETTFERLLREAHTAGRSAREQSPSVPIALITHKPELAERSAFDYVVPVRPDLLVEGAERGAGYTPQWFTRLYYYASSPFNLTIAIDSNAGVCAPLEPLFAAASQWDFAVPSQLRECFDHWPHNYMMTYSWTPRTEALFNRWIMAQLRVGVPIDDQQTLYTAIHETEGHRIKHPLCRFLSGTAGDIMSPECSKLRVGRILGSAQGAISLNTLDKTFKNFIPAVTPLLRGRAAVVHPFFGAAANCAAWTPPAQGVRSQDRPYLFVATPHGQSLQLKAATSRAECTSIANQTYLA